MKREKLQQEMLLKAYLKNAEQFLDTSFVRFKRYNVNDLKNILKEKNIPYYEAELEKINKREIDAKDGESFNPIVSFINKDKKQKVLIINIKNPFRKKDFDALFNLKFFNEIDKEAILPNTLVFLNETEKDILENFYEKANNLYQQRYKSMMYGILYF